jgi:large conductance mechanosensitive channel
MPVMRKLWREFKGFAMSGNMLDLALGFLLGAAFAKLIESLAGNVLMQFVAAIFGQQDFTKLVATVNGAQIKYGQFLTDLLNFLMLAGVLFLIVKFIVFVGVGQRRVFGDRDCPFCYERIPPNALICKHCGQQLVAELPSLDEAERLAEQQRSRRKVGLPALPLPHLPIPGRRRSRSGDDGSGDEGSGDEGSGHDRSGDDRSDDEPDAPTAAKVPHV